MGRARASYTSKHWAVIKLRFTSGQLSGHKTTRVVSLLFAKGNCHNRRWCWLVKWYTKQWRHLSYLSSYKTVSTCIHVVETHTPAAYSGVAANTTTIPCAIGHQAHSSCPSWLSFISVIFQAQLGASYLARQKVGPKWSEIRVNSQLVKGWPPHLANLNRWKFASISSMQTCLHSIYYSCNKVSTLTNTKVSFNVMDYFQYWRANFSFL